MSQLPVRQATCVDDVQGAERVPRPAWRCRCGLVQLQGPRTPPLPASSRIPEPHDPRRRRARAVLRAPQPTRDASHRFCALEGALRPPRPPPSPCLALQHESGRHLALAVVACALLFPGLPPPQRGRLQDQSRHLSPSGCQVVGCRDGLPIAPLVLRRGPDHHLELIGQTLHAERRAR